MRRAPREALQLVRQQRRVGRDDDDDRARLLGHRRQTAGPRRRGDGISCPTGTPAMRSSLRRAVIRLHEHADGVAARLLDSCATPCRCRP